MVGLWWIMAVPVVDQGWACGGSWLGLWWILVDHGSALVDHGRAFGGSWLSLWWIMVGLWWIMFGFCDFLKLRF